MVGYTRGDFGNAKFVSDKSVKKGAAIAGAGLAAGAALKYGVSKYRANKAKEAQQKQQAQNAQAESGTNCESWIDDPAAQLLQDRKRREDRDRAAEVEDRVGIRDHTGIDDLVPQIIQKADLMQDRDDDQDQCRFAEIVQGVDNTDSALLGACANGAYDRRGHAVAQVHADDHRIDGFKGQSAGRGERLQDTDRRRRTLQHEGNACAGCISQKRIVSKEMEQPHCRNAGKSCFKDQFIRRAGSRLLPASVFHLLKTFI